MQLTEPIDGAGEVWATDLSGIQAGVLSPTMPPLAQTPVVHAAIALYPLQTLGGSRISGLHGKSIAQYASTPEEERFRALTQFLVISTMPASTKASVLQRGETPLLRLKLALLFTPRQVRIPHGLLTTDAAFSHGNRWQLHRETPRTRTGTSTEA